MRCLVVLRFFSLLVFVINSQDRISSYPYISGDTFRAFADHIIDETGVPFEVDSVKRGDIIFVKTDYLGYFFSAIHSRIKNRYILLTHNSDYAVPGSEFTPFLDDPKLYAWFGQNIDRKHPKLHAIPIGMANYYWPHGKIEVFKALQDQNIDKSIFLYINYSPNTSSERANTALEKLMRLSCAYVPTRKPFADYARDLAQSVFVVSPPGNGLDCHRTWEALYLGAIPIVKRTSIAVLYENLPIMIVDDWSEVTEQSLMQTLMVFREKGTDLHKVYADYWFALLRNIQEECRESYYDLPIIA